MVAKSPEDVLLAISSALKNSGYTRVSAAKKLGMNPGTLSNILSAKKYLSAKQAGRFREAFGYNVKFMMTGEENLVIRPSDLVAGYDAVSQEAEGDLHVLSEHSKRVLISSETKKDMIIILSWFREAFSRRGDTLGLELCSEALRFSQADDYINSKVDIGPEPMTLEEREYQLWQYQNEISKKADAILRRMTEER